MPEFFYLMKGWDMNTWQQFIPDPGLFRTEEEAKLAIDRWAKGNVYYTYEKVTLGLMKKD